MGKTFNKITAREESRVYERMIHVRDQYHPALRDAGVTVELVGVSASRDKNDEAAGPALKHHGYPARAIIKIRGLEDRAAGSDDARILFDADAEPEWSGAELDALLDHELAHLELVTDKDGGLVHDDVGRPKLRMRVHDFEIGGFHHIAKRHGPNAGETQQVAAVGSEAVRQGWLNGF